MAQIEGLKEQQAALTRVKNNLKKIGDINDFLKSVSGLAGEKDVEATYNISISFTAGEDIKRFKCPLLVEDNRYILEAAQRYKESIAAEVKKDSEEYRITLSPKENATLEWALTLG